MSALGTDTAQSLGKICSYIWFWWTSYQYVDVMPTRCDSCCTFTANVSHLPSSQHIIKYPYFPTESYIWKKSDFERSTRFCRCRATSSERRRSLLYKDIRKWIAIIAAAPPRCQPDRMTEKSNGAKRENGLLPLPMAILWNVLETIELTTVA